MFLATQAIYSSVNSNNTPNLLTLKLNLGGQGTAPTVSGWVNVWGEANPNLVSGDIDKTLYASWGNLGGTGIDFVANNGGTAATRWGLFGGTSYGNTGQSTGADSGIYPDNVLIHLWFVNNASANVTCQLKNVPNGTYTVTLLGSRDSGVGGSRPSRFSVNGGSTQDLECIGNTSNKLDFTGITPSSGTITIRLQSTTNNFAYINSIILTQTA